jgi:Zn ribbon nucleic-acid-binding protein
MGSEARDPMIYAAGNCDIVRGRTRKRLVAGAACVGNRARGSAAAWLS